MIIRERGECINKPQVKVHLSEPFYQCNPRIVEDVATELSGLFYLSIQTTSVWTEYNNLLKIEKKRKNKVRKYKMGFYS